MFKIHKKTREKIMYKIHKQIWGKDMGKNQVQDP